MRIYLFNFHKIKNPLLAILYIGLATIIFTAVLVKPDETLPVRAKPQAISKVRTSQKVAALTFNISWGSKVPVLDILKTHNQQATFFISSAWATKYPQLARRIAAEGHEIGGFLDSQFIPDQSTPAGLQEELLKISKSTTETCGVNPTLLRVSHGELNGQFLSTAAEAGYTVVQWDLNSLDIQMPGKDTIISNVINNVQPGSIILLNASDTASQTPGALSGIIDGLKKNGYELVTVSSLLKAGRGVAE